MTGNSSWVGGEDLCGILFVFPSVNLHLWIEFFPSDNLSREWRKACFMKLVNEYDQPPNSHLSGYITRYRECAKK